MIDLDTLTLPQLWRELVNERALRTLLELARDEDLDARGDITSELFIDASSRARAHVRARRPGVVAGLETVPALLRVFGVDVRWTPRLVDGAPAARDATLGTLDGSRRGILAVERTLLNILSRLCGVATTTRRFVEAVAGSRAAICDTRKTTPGLRSLEKHAVRCGGGSLHRLGLFDAVLLKDNHIAGTTPGDLARRVAEMAARARAAHDLRFVEVEVDALEQLDALLALPAGAIDIVLLDNMTTAQLADAVGRRGGRTRPLLEASGGVSLETVQAIAATGVDRISVGALTHSAGILDLGLDIE
ncbi:MAG: carboxylating nicotinate-nucleotide diphosphorylase [Phycisphaerales bacterium]